MGNLIPLWIKLPKKNLQIPFSATAWVWSNTTLSNVLVHNMLAKPYTKTNLPYWLFYNPIQGCIQDIWKMLQKISYFTKRSVVVGAALEKKKIKRISFGENALNVYFSLFFLLLIFIRSKLRFEHTKLVYKTQKIALITFAIYLQAVKISNINCVTIDIYITCNQTFCEKKKFFARPYFNGWSIQNKLLRRQFSFIYWAQEFLDVSIFGSSLLRSWISLSIIKFSPKKKINALTISHPHILLNSWFLAGS